MLKQQRKIVCFFSFLLLICSSEQARANNDWIKFGSNSEEISFLNFKSEVWEGTDIVSIWELVNLKNKGDFGESSHLIYWTFNCAKRAYVFRQIMYYDEKFAEGTEVVSSSFPNREFKFTKPGSHINALMRFMCKLD